MYMHKIFEVFAGFIVLIFMGVVLWQIIGMSSTKELPDDDYEPVVCNRDALMCPDGSYVGRTAPNCDFAECPVLNQEEKRAILCSPESKLAEICTADYSPVCGIVEVQCVTTPCDPIPQTFGNACGACAQGGAISYTEGSCQSDLQVN
jgi:hypothetical protein